MELVNGYQELRDKNRLKTILENDIKKKYKEIGKKYKLDNRFIDATEKLPKCSGASLGLDRLLMILLDIGEIV